MSPRRSQGYAFETSEAKSPVGSKIAYVQADVPFPRFAYSPSHPSPQKFKMIVYKCLSLMLLVPFGLALHTRRQTNSSTVPYSLKTPPLDTPWTSQVGTDPWPQYPRPKLQRSQWQSLNGIGWTYQNASSLDAVNNPPFNQALANQVLIPSCVESGLSGIQTSWNLYSWFSTHFTVPQNWTGDRVLLNFGAVDYEATIFINGRQAGFNRGGYFAFTIDVTPYLNGGSNELSTLR